MSTHRLGKYTERDVSFYGHHASAADATSRLGTSKPRQWTGLTGQDMEDRYGCAAFHPF